VPLVWAGAGLVLTGMLLAGDQDVRPHAPALIAGAVGTLPDGVSRPRLRADSGLFSADAAYAAVTAGAEVAIAAFRDPAVRAAIRPVPCSWQATDSATRSPFPESARYVAPLRRFSPLCEERHACTFWGSIDQRGDR
jgi:hypothetical protein